MCSTLALQPSCSQLQHNKLTALMHEIIYLIGLIVVVMFVLGALGLR